MRKSWGTRRLCPNCSPISRRSRAYVPSLSRHRHAPLTSWWRVGCGTSHPPSAGGTDSPHRRLLVPGSVHLPGSLLVSAPTATATAQEGQEGALDIVLQTLLPIVALFTRDVNSQVRWQMPLPAPNLLCVSSIEHHLGSGPAFLY